MKKFQNIKEVPINVDACTQKELQNSDKEIVENKKWVKRLNTRMFAVGMISGIAITFVINFIKKKKYLKGLLRYFPL